MNGNAGRELELARLTTEIELFQGLQEGIRKSQGDLMKVRLKARVHEMRARNKYKELSGHAYPGKYRNADWARTYRGEGKR